MNADEMFLARLCDTPPQPVNAQHLRCAAYFARRRAVGVGCIDALSQCRSQANSRLSSRTSAYIPVKESFQACPLARLQAGRLVGLLACEALVRVKRSSQRSDRPSVSCRPSPATAGRSSSVFSPQARADPGQWAYFPLSG